MYFPKNFIGSIRGLSSRVPLLLPNAIVLINRSSIQAAESRVINISTRARVEAGANVFIADFVISGTGKLIYHLHFFVARKIVPVQQG